jgi:hydroxymethylbilane synthase
VTKLKVATRGSALALHQVELLREALRAEAPEVEVEIRIVKTQGDRDQATPLEEIGGQGVFVRDIERFVLSGEAQVAVHSLKDMPALLPPGLRIAAVLPRDDPRDVLVSRGRTPLAELPARARIGTDSRRRAVQLLKLRPDLEVCSIRGNVDTRVRKVEAGEYDAAVLAAAGLDRLGLAARIDQVFDVDELLPAVGQAIIALQCHADDESSLDLLGRVNHAATWHAMTAERAFLARLGAGCRLPVGAYAEVERGRVHMRALLADEAARIHRDQATLPLEQCHELGAAMAERLAAAAGIELNGAVAATAPGSEA